MFKAIANFFKGNNDELDEIEAKLDAKRESSR